MEDQEHIKFLIECRVCKEMKPQSEMVQLKGNATKICRKCSLIVYKKKNNSAFSKSELAEIKRMKQKVVNYSDRLKDSQGYIRDLEYKPLLYELVDLKLKNGRNICGWWTGQEWYGRMLRPNHEIIGWKRKTSIRG